MFRRDPSIDEMTPPESWLWAGEGWEQRAGRHVGRILAAEIRSLDPHETGLRWAEAYGLELLSSGDDWRIEMGGTEIRFTYDAECLEPALMAIDFEAIDLPAVCTTADELGLERDDCVVTVCGVDFNFM